MRNTLFFYKPYGRLGNRLLRYSNLASWCWENGLTLWDPTLSDYEFLFPTFLGDPLFSNNVQINRSSLVLGIRKILRFAIVKMAYLPKFPHLSCDDRVGRFFDLNGEEGKSWLKANNKYPLIRIEGFWYTSGELREKYRNRLLRMFTPSMEILDQINQNLLLADSNKKLIGIHVRRTDYSNFMEGGGYYDWDEYRNLMLMLMNRLAPDQVQFLVCCDESIPENFMNGLPILLGLGSINDIFTLSYCDLIIGPRSTFSNWASFIGNKLLIELWGHPIWKKHQDEELEKCINLMNLKPAIRNPYAN